MACSHYLPSFVIFKIQQHGLGFYYLVYMQPFKDGFLGSSRHELSSRQQKQPHLETACFCLRSLSFKGETCLPSTGRGKEKDRRDVMSKVAITLRPTHKSALDSCLISRLIFLLDTEGLIGMCSFLKNFLLVVLIEVTTQITKGWTVYYWLWANASHQQQNPWNSL